MSAILTRVASVPYIVKVGVLATCYFAAAKASLLFAIPPGYATAVWPPAGIALAALLLHGVRIWPGVWLGAVLANFSVNQSLTLAAGIATGITERKRIEEALRPTGEPLRTVADKPPDAIFRKNRGGRYRLFSHAASLRLACLMLALVSPGTVAQAAVETQRTLRVVLDNAYAAYAFQSDAGKVQGHPDRSMAGVGKEDGIKVESHAMDWCESLRRMRAGKFDVIASIVETAERRDCFDFTPAYSTIEASIYFRHDISCITDLASLKGFPIAVKTGDQYSKTQAEWVEGPPVLFVANHLANEKEYVDA